MFSERTDWDLGANRLSAALTRLRSDGKNVLDLTASNPTGVGLECDADAVLRALQNRNALKYEPDPCGLSVARNAVAEYYAARDDAVSPDDLILTTGTSEAYSFLLRLLCNPGDEVLIPQPGYPLLSYLADLCDARLIRYPLFHDHGWRIDFRTLESAITSRTRAIVVVHPNNPTGHYTSAAEMAHLNEICSVHDLAIIADEVFWDFLLLDARPATFAGNLDALTFTLSGVSKICGLPQMKASWLAASGPEESKRQALNRLEVITDTFLSMNAPIQLALPAFLALRGDFQERLMRRVRKNLAELDRQIGAQLACKRLRVEGGWYAVLQIPAIQSDEELAINLLKRHGVYVHPGHYYDFHGDGFIVVSLITREVVFREGIAQLLSMF